jgi:RsiW-degrading membrane proteinase PrsW (M82 family)
VGSNAPHLGTRAYCPEHWASLSRNRASTWRSGLLSVVVLTIYALAAAWLLSVWQPALSGVGLTVAGAVLALIPALLWLAFFYAQDRLEPEPKGHVLGVFVLGALLASAVGIPIVRDLFQVQDWLGSGPLVNLLGSILVVGFVQSFLVYAAVRYSVYLSPEFDERFDGILYGTAAGLGFATVLNINFVVENGGVNLSVAVIQSVITALVHASFGGLLGYFLGRAKFEDEPVWWLPAGLTLVATLNGLFAVTWNAVIQSGSVLSGQTINPWLGLVLAIVVAGATFVALIFLIRRANRLTLAGADVP